MRGRRTALVATGLCATLLAALLAGCATTLDKPARGEPDALRREALQALARYGLRGQIAASNGNEGFSAQLAWQQQGDGAHASLRSALGLGGAQLDLRGDDLHFEGGDGRILDGDAAQQALARSLGFVPPLASLRYWLLAVPDPQSPADEQADAQGRPVQIAQSGWQVDYADYQAVQGRWLPGRITLQRAPLRLKLRVLHWDLP